MERLSTGLVAAVMQTGSFKGSMANGIIHIRSGSQPASADDTETGTLLAEITLDGGVFVPITGTNGINFGTVVAGVLEKAAAEAWSGLGLAAAGAGTAAGWFRFYDINETLGASTEAVRFDGAIATSGAELNMPNTTITEDGSVSIDTFGVTLPQS